MSKEYWERWENHKKKKHKEKLTIAILKGSLIVFSVLFILAFFTNH